VNRHPISARERFSWRRNFRALERFFQVEAASTFLLLLATAVALLWANSSTSAAYTFVWQTPLPLRLGPWHLSHSMQFWINDALMTFFFLLVGLEIRSELHDGVLSDRKVATLPVVAALGGIALPALLFLALNPDPPLRRGWAIATATDIAFAVGALMLLGRRAPRPLRVLLLAVAIVDDIGAVIVIALYYSDGFVASGVALAAGAIVLVLALQRLGLQRAAWYFLPGTLLWYALGRAGIHPTLAGVILGLLTPVGNKQVPGAQPLGRLKNALHPWVAFGIMPLFALANAGVELRGLATTAASTVSLGAGVMLGLVIGKPLGIVSAATLWLRSGLGALPGEIRWRHLLVLGCLGGVGFTMSIFLAQLAFSHAEPLSMAKAAVLLASVVAAGAGLVIGRLVLSNPA
jgi:Na+:H+ antiporter, NhaA family